MTAGELPENSNYALEKLRALLNSADQVADGKLPTERALSEMFGVGRRAVRRALEVLEAEGRISRRQGAGTYVGQRPEVLGRHVGAIVAGTNFLEIMEVRLRVEPQRAQLAAVRAKAADIDRMYELTKKIEASEDVDSRELWDGALHRLIAQSAGNQFFLEIFDVINHVRQDDAWQAIRGVARRSHNTEGRAYAQHTAVVDAIAAHDPARAAEAMRQHLLMLQESLTRVTSFSHPEEERRPGA